MTERKPFKGVPVASRSASSRHNDRRRRSAPSAGRRRRSAPSNGRRRHAPSNGRRRRNAPSRKNCHRRHARNNGRRNNCRRLTHRSAPKVHKARDLPTGKLPEPQFN